jgi:Eco57I restriction-modification methylase/TaqI-like C-terminal specificity domain
MIKTFSEGQDKIAELCAYFDTNHQNFLAAGVKEAHVRQSLIDPFFLALGWDVGNAAMAAPQYREVVPEDSLEIEGHQKAPDYAFRVGTMPKFYAEAKKCGININADPAPAYQLRRYGWSAKIPLSILTDFEEFAVYDCSLRPRQGEKSSRARILYLGFEEYPDRWREIWDVFSREAVWSGAYDQFSASKRKRGTSEVDNEFLKEIETWRENLARNIALRNAGISADDLNAAVQLTIDRIVFLRMAEDRGLEPYARLLKLCERPGMYSRFVRDVCRRADAKYNSGLFHFRNESDISEAPDRITPNLTIDDKVLKPILQSLYFEHGSPYHFGVLPVEILGTVYERFLGKVIRLTAGHRAKIEEKPEVRKAGGVYYTPKYIVDYIVEHTVGKQVEGRSPAQLAGGGGKPTFRALDMACGSGSFLLGAYRYLMDYALKWYVEHKPESHKKAVFQDARDGQWRLNIEEKKRLLTTHIYGVDIDAQAVEVTKLSLLLKALEGENDASLSKQMELIQTRALPNLADNIKCGNSLIGPDYFTGDLLPDTDDIKRVNPFDWNTGFPEAMKAGGFDCVIGNPPYGAFFDELGKRFLLSEFNHQSYRLDSYLLFLEKAVRDLARVGGHFGMIIPNPWLTNIRQKNMRMFVVNNTCVEKIVHFGFPVFPRVVVDTEIVVLRKGFRADWDVEVVLVNELDVFLGLSDNETVSKVFHPQEEWRGRNGDVINIFASEAERRLVSKIRELTHPLETHFAINVGIKPYQSGKGHPTQTKKTVRERPFDSENRLTKEYRQYLRGRDINRYLISPTASRFLRYGPWLAEPRPAANFDAPLKIVMRQTGDSLIAALDTSKFLCLNNMHVLVPKAIDFDPHFALGLINSKLWNWFYHNMNPEVGEALAEVKKTNVARLPFRTIDFDDAADKARHDRMVQLVESMLALHKQLAVAASEAQKTILQRQIDATDAEIDRLVYELYDLTPEEIAIVEGEA